MLQVVGRAGVAGAVVSRSSFADGTSQAGGAAWGLHLPVTDQVAEGVCQGFTPTDGGKA